MADCACMLAAFAKLEGVSATASSPVNRSSHSPQKRVIIVLIERIAIIIILLLLR